MKSLLLALCVSLSLASLASAATLAPRTVTKSPTVVQAWEMCWYWGGVYFCDSIDE